MVEHVSDFHEESGAVYINFVFGCLSGELSNSYILDHMAECLHYMWSFSTNGSYGSKLR